MNGGFGFDVYGFVSTDVTAKGWSARPSFSRWAATSSSTATSSRLVWPVAVEVAAAGHPAAVDGGELRR